jgi:LAGLIDADG-like domain
MADGSYCRDRDNKKRMDGVAISTGSNDYVCRWLERFCSSHYCRVLSNGRTTRVIQYRKKGDVNFWSATLAARIYGMFGDANSYNKCVPKEIFTASDSCIAAFLRGYFSGDGSLHLRNGQFIVDCSSVNRSLVEDISVLLDRIGIKNNINSGHSRGLCWGKYQQRLQYKLKVEHGLAVNRFMDLVGFIQAKLFVRRTKFNDEKGRPVSIRGIREKKFVGEKPVYDISTTSETFVANGILCHKSGSMLSDDETGSWVKEVISAELKTAT